MSTTQLYCSQLRFMYFSLVSVWGRRGCCCRRWTIREPFR